MKLIATFIAASTLASLASAATYNLTGQSVTVGKTQFTPGVTKAATTVGGSLSGAGSTLAGNLNFVNAGVTGGAGKMTYSSNFNVNLANNSFTTSGKSCTGVGCAAFPASDTFTRTTRANGFDLAFNNAYFGTNYDFKLSFTSVAEVPVPAAAWLFGSALLGLGGMARRRSA